MNAEQMERKYLKRGKNKQYFMLKKLENKKIFSTVRSIRKKISKISKEKIETANKVYEAVLILAFFLKK